MEFVKMLFVNTSILVAVAYVANLVYKYILNRTSARVKYICMVLLAIFCGWVSIVYGYRLTDTVIFDLRVLPLIVATLTFGEPFTLIIIGTGIGLSRLAFGINDASIVGCFNLSLLGFVAAGINIWMRKKGFSLIKRGVIAIFSINTINAIVISVVGVTPFRLYISEIIPIVLPLGIFLSIIFCLILRDFHLEQLRMVQVKQNNVLLSKQAEELQKAKLILEERADQLMRSSQYKTEFLANMSHELRTPLNSIINLAEIISDRDSTRSPDENAMYANIIYKSGHDLLKLINDILDLSKVEAGQLEIVSEDMNISEIPELIQMQFEMVAEKNNIRFEITIDDLLPGTLYCDPQRVQQILINLLSNAFKFTNEGKVTLDIYKIHQEEQGSEHLDWIVFSVTDTGIGISQDKHQIVFEAFQQAEGSISRNYGGTGLGLSISQNLAHLLGGDIQMESVEGEGSTFSLYLPLNHIDR
ncbi:two-component system chemotaxis sensor kinase CheA [Paenibacillus sp. DS2015]|uniref:ATP-binding protein n=1 Tax=Paenibacillus sp. DS2015 TaxID=3373917 RepID=UPI003D23FDBE